MTAPFKEDDSADQNLAEKAHRVYRSASLLNDKALQVAYPRVAADHGCPPMPYDEARIVLEGLGANVAHGEYAGSTITREEYESYTSNLKISRPPIGDNCRGACSNFLKHYAFSHLPKFPSRAPMNALNSNIAASEVSQASIWLLASLINHCCTPPRDKEQAVPNPTKTARESGAIGPNCRSRIGPSGLCQFIRPKHIVVEALRAIEEGEQLTWDYGKNRKGFNCECTTCKARSPLSHCGVL